MATTGKGLPRSLGNATTVAGTDSGVYKVVSRDVAGNIISGSSVVTVS